MILKASPVKGPKIMRKSLSLVLAPLIITQKDEEAVQNLFDFFMINKVNEKHVQAAMKRLRQMRKLRKKTAS